MHFFNGLPRLPVVLILAIWSVAALCAAYLPSEVARDIDSINPMPSLWKALSGWKGFLKSDFPEISSLYYSIVWFSYPLFFYILWRWLEACMKKGIDGLLVKPDLKLSDKALIVFAIPVFALLTYGIAMGNEGQGLRYLELGSSRFDLAMFGIIAPAAAAICSVIVVFGLSRLFGFGSTK